MSTGTAELQDKLHDHDMTQSDIVNAYMDQIMPNH